MEVKEKKKYARIHVHADTETRLAWEWLKERDYNVSAVIKTSLLSRVAELKAKEQSNG